MHRAVYASDQPGLKLFMQARPQGLKQADHHGNTPLLLALKLERTEMAWLMVRAGAELDVPSDGSFHLLVGLFCCTLHLLGEGRGGPERVGVWPVVKSRP